MAIGYLECATLKVFKGLLALTALKAQPFQLKILDILTIFLRDRSFETRQLRLVTVVPEQKLRKFQSFKIGPVAWQPPPPSVRQLLSLSSPPPRSYSASLHPVSSVLAPGLTWILF